MPANVKTKTIKPLIQEAYLKNGSARKILFYKIYITQNWEKEGHIQLLVSRKHVTGNVTGALFAIDRWCKGPYILEPDNEKIEFIDIECGKNGRVVLSAEVWDTNAMTPLKLLEKNWVKEISI